MFEALAVLSGVWRWWLTDLTREKKIGAPANKAHV